MHQTQPSARESQSRIWTQIYVTPKTGFPLASKFWNFYSTVEYRGRKNLERPHCLQPMSQAFCLHQVGKIILSSLGILRMMTTKGWLQWCAGKCLTLLSKEKKKNSQTNNTSPPPVMSWFVAFADFCRRRQWCHPLTIADFRLPVWKQSSRSFCTESTDVTALHSISAL